MVSRPSGSFRVILEPRFPEWVPIPSDDFLSEVDPEWDNADTWDSMISAADCANVSDICSLVGMVRSSGARWPAIMLKGAVPSRLPNTASFSALKYFCSFSSIAVAAIS